MKKLQFLVVVCLMQGIATHSKAQEAPFTESFAEVRKQQAMSSHPTKSWDSLRCAWYGECIEGSPLPASLVTVCPLNKRMFGWHAIGTSAASYQWSLLTDLSYFSYQVDPVTGNAVNASQVTAFPANSTVTTALANGVKVNLCVTLFNSTTEFSSFFASATAQATLITNLVNAVQAANATGINIDFEGSGLATTYQTPFVSFISALSTQLHNTIPNSDLSIDLQGTYANSATLLNQLLPHIDLFILMGYDYYWGGQFYPGPIAPTYQFPAAAGDPYGHGNVSNDLNNLLKYVPASKTILGMPYYGRRWRTTNGCVLPATGSAASISTQTYSQFRQNSNGYYNSTLRDPVTFNAYHCFTDINAIANQQFIDDSFSLQKKYNLVRQRGIAGVAVWRLGYDAGYNDCWNLVNNNLSTCAVTSLTDTLYDMGGPAGSYHNAENYTFSIQPPDVATITLSFLDFNLENGYDSLWIYDGNSTSAPLLGRFSGTGIPGAITANSGMMTIRFRSDNATTAAGYRAVYTCTQLFKSISQGNWNNPATWLPGLVPASGDSVIISPAHQVELTGTATARSLHISNTGSLLLNDPGANLTVGDNLNKTRKLNCYGSLQLNQGNIHIYGGLQQQAGSSFNMTGGQLLIDGNSGMAATSMADGQQLFDISAGATAFVFSGGMLQFTDPPLGANSQAVSCPFNFGSASILKLGDGISTTASDNPDGFGGDRLPGTIGRLVLDAASLNNNRVFKNRNPLRILTSCEVKSGNLVQAALFNVGN